MPIPTELFHFSSQAMPKDTFYVTNFSGREGLNTLFNFTINLVSKNLSVDTAKVLESEATFIIHRDNGEDAVFKGYPVLIQQGGFFNGYAYYQVELRPIFWKLTQVIQSTIFLDKTIKDVADELLKSQQFFMIPHEFHLTKTDYPAPEFAMQYGESVYDYLLFRLEEQGAYFFFKQNEDKIIFADSPQSHEADQISVIYSPTSGLEGDKREEVVTSFNLIQTPLPRRVVVRSFDWKNPKRPVVGEAEVSLSGIGDVYLSNEKVESDSEANRIAKIRAEELICRSRLFQGLSSIPVLRPGVVFSLKDHYNQTFNSDYLITEITHEGAQETFLSLGLGINLKEMPEHLFYRNNFTSIPSQVAYRPARTAKRASIPGVIRGFVDGAGSGARAEMDEYGRYKLLFPFDISGRQKGKASCWIRMAQPQVGQDSGLSFPLLPGTEVTVAFLDGNPDYPIITGALPNGETGSLTGVGNSNFSGIRTPGGNQLTINDTDTHQGISLQTASGLGLTMTAGSLGATSQHQDLSLDLTSFASNEIANLGKTLLTGCRNVTVASQDCFAWITAITTAIQKGFCNSLDSLAKKAAKDKDYEKQEKFKWSSAAIKDAGMLITNMVSTIKGFKAPENKYGISLVGSKKASKSTLQVWPGSAKMMALILVWFTARSLYFGSEMVDSALEAADAEKKATETMDEDLKKAGGKTPSNDEERKATYTEITNKLAKEIAKAMENGDAQTAQTLQNQLTALQKDYNVLYNEKSADYYKYAKAETRRKAVISSVQDMLPEITAILLQFKLLGGEDLEHGGISLSSPDRNINLDALKTISLHSPKGIFLNTNRDNDSGTWGVKDRKNYEIGAKNINSLKPFVAVKTTNRYVEAVTNEEQYQSSLLKADIAVIKHKDDQDFFKILKNNATIQSKNIMLKVNSGNQPSLNLDPNGISLFADTNHETGLSINKSNNDVVLLNSGAILGLSNDGKISLTSNGGSTLTLGDEVIISPNNNKTRIGDISIEGNQLKGAVGGIIDLGGQIKIIGENAGAQPSVQLSNEFLTAVKNQLANINQAQNEGKIQENKVQQNVVVEQNQDKGNLNVQENLVNNIP